MMDEVQTGLGRTGSWFGFEHGGDVHPDVVTMAKALGNGMPIGACWARADVASAFKPGDHASTFGGQPLAARAALTTLDVMEREDVPRRAAAAGKRLTAGLLAVDGVVSVRGAGLLLGAEMAAEKAAGPIASTCLERGLVVNAVTPTVVRFAPPLLVTDADIDRAVQIFSEVVRDA
jgi:acetylornithine/N-succinyldiaminopimelate aminotransferase